TVVEPVQTRDHTEVMLAAMGADVTVDGLRVAVCAAQRLQPLHMHVPGDFSAAAFWLVAGGLVGGSDVRLLGVGVNPTRTALEAGLSAMGGDITASEDGWVINGPRRLEGARVDSGGDHRIAMALAVAALIADGKTEIEGAECVDISYPEFFDQLDYLA